MSDRSRHVVQLELELAGSQIAGRLTSQEGTVRDFSGWIGLAQALETVVGRASPTPTEGGASQCSDD